MYLHTTYCRVHLQNAITCHLFSYSQVPYLAGCLHLLNSRHAVGTMSFLGFGFFFVVLPNSVGIISPRKMMARTQLKYQQSPPSFSSFSSFPPTYPHAPTASLFLLAHTSPPSSHSLLLPIISLLPSIPSINRSRTCLSSSFREH